MEIALRTKVLSLADVTAIAGDRVDWGEASQGTERAYVVLHLLNDIPEMLLSGPSGWRDAHVQADCWSTDVLEARDLAGALQAGLLGLRDVVDGKKRRIVGITVVSDSDDSGEVTKFRSFLDFYVHYQA